MKGVVTTMKVEIQETAFIAYQFGQTIRGLEVDFDWAISLCEISEKEVEAEYVSDKCLKTEPIPELGNQELFIGESQVRFIEH